MSHPSATTCARFARHGSRLPPSHAAALWYLSLTFDRMPFHRRLAAIRMGAGTATVLTLLCMSHLMDQRPLADFGLHFDGNAAIVTAAAK